MTRLTKKILSAVLAGAMVLAMGVSAFAADEPATTTGLAEAKMTKDLKVADGVDIDAVENFTFSFTFNDSKSVGYKEGDKVPTISPQTITVSDRTDGEDHAYGSKALSEVFTSADAFPHAGVFAYTVKETTEASTTTEGGVTKSLTVDDSVYTVLLHVTNKQGGGLEFSGVEVLEGEEKKDPTIKEGEKTSGFNFENTYAEVIEETEDGVLTITKKVEGKYGDKTKKFPVTVTLSIPSTASELDVVLDTSKGASLTGLVATADLADGDEIKFTKLPSGTTFKVEETQDANYAGKIEGTLITTATFDKGANVSATSTGPVVEAGQTVTLTNTREDVIPTGVIINNLPYMLMVAIAVAGVAYMQLKKRI